MKNLISNFPQHIIDAIAICNNTKLKKNNNNISNIIICGMGGSGIAAKIVFDHVKNKIKLPYYINKDYKLPGFVNKKSLVVVCSYSGNTEEALSCFKEAIKNNDLKEAADALTDILYVTYGAGQAFGINLDKCFNEVQESNMSKLGEDGKPIYNDEGKVMKGPKYFKPDLSKFLE